MRFVNRVARLEKTFTPQPPGPCWSCESINPATGLTMFLCGVRLSLDDGTDLCFCKVCAREFQGRLECESAGYTVVRDMADAVIPV